MPYKWSTNRIGGPLGCGRRVLNALGVEIMSWLMLAAAGLLEVVWAYAMKLSDGFTRPLYSIVTFVGMIASFALLSAAMRSLPLGAAYTIWTGIGAVGSFVAGLYFLGEPATPMRILAAVVIGAGLIMMKLAS